MALLRQIKLIEGGGELINRRTCLTEIVPQRRRGILFSMLMFMPVVPAILTRNKRHFGIAVGDPNFLEDARF